MKNSKESEYCTICRRLLDNPADPLSGNCGGDCWGCIGSIEADMGCAESLAYVRKEYEAGLRRGFGEGFQVEDNQATKKTTEYIRRHQQIKSLTTRAHYAGEHAPHIIINEKNWQAPPLSLPQTERLQTNRNPYPPPEP